MTPDLIDGHGGIPAERAEPDHSARDLAQLVVQQAVEDLATVDPALRRDVMRWMIACDAEACGIEWCATALGVSVEGLIRSVFEAAHGLRLRRYVHRREIEQMHNPAQMRMAV